MSIQLIKDETKVTEITTKLKDLVSKTIDNKDNDKYFQAVLDVINDGYFNKDNEYGEQCEELENISPVLSFLNIYAGYSYQVCNGGHTQYFDNGYASGCRGAFRADNRDTELHDKKLVPLFKSLGLDSTEVGKKVLDILTDFEIDYLSKDEYETCYECRGSGYVTEEVYVENEDEDDEGEYVEEEVHCDNCDGNGEILETEAGIQNTGLLEKLDDRFYAIYEEFESTLEDYIKTWINSEGKVWMPEITK